MWSISDAARITVSYIPYCSTDFLNPSLSYFHVEITSDCGKTAGIDTELRNRVSVEENVVFDGCSIIVDRGNWL